MPLPDFPDERFHGAEPDMLTFVNPVLSGIFTGVLVFFGLLFGLGAWGAVGPVELLLFLVIGVVSGVAVSKLLRLGSSDKS